jgi:hypothetical protein
MTKKKLTREALKKERRLNRMLGNLYENEIAKAHVAANPRIKDRGKTLDLTADEYTKTETENSDQTNGRAERSEKVGYLSGGSTKQTNQ